MKPRLSTVLKWLGRLAALLLLLFWGAFFVAHLSEWFLQGSGQYPPPRVWVSQFFHLVMVIGLLVMLKWDRAGTVALLAGAAGFVLTIWDADILRIVAVNLVPVLLFAGGRWAGRH